MVLERKFSTKLPFRPAKSTCTEPGQLRLHTNHHPAEMSTRQAAFQLYWGLWNLPTSGCMFCREQEAPQVQCILLVAQEEISASLHQLRSALTLGKYPGPWNAQITPRNLQIPQLRTKSSSSCDGLTVAWFSSQPLFGCMPTFTDVHRR